MAQVIDQRFLIVKRPPLHLIMASFMGERQYLTTNASIRISIDRPLVKPRYQSDSDEYVYLFVVDTVSRDESLQEVVLGLTCVPDYDEAGGEHYAASIVLDNSRKSYLRRVDDSQFLVYDNGGHPVFPQLLNR